MKIIKHIFVLLFIAIFFQGIDALAQVQWSPTTISINARVIEKHYTWSDCPDNQYSNTSLEPVDFILNFASTSLQQYSRSGDSIDLFCLGLNRRCNQGKQDGFSLSFIFDSLHGKLNNLFLYYTGPDNADRCVDPFDILITSLNFIIANDTLIASGAVLKDSVSKKDLRVIDFVAVCSSGKDYRFGSEWYLDSLLGDVNFSITFVNSRLINSASSAITTAQKLYVINNFLFNRADFSFPFSDQPRQISIYDIFGREIYRTQITPGTTQFTLPTSQFTSGHYFARLGNMTAHFAVY